MIRLSNIKIQSKIVDFIAKNEETSTGMIKDYLESVSRPTLSRYLKELKELNVIATTGDGRSTKYKISRDGIKSYAFDVSLYDIPYQTTLTIHFNHELLQSASELLTKIEKSEIARTNILYKTWEKKVDVEYKNLALERCSIEFAWKSSKIEGNTYSLLETENLIKNKEEAIGKPHGDAIMILNQKKVFDCIAQNSVFTSVSIHTLIDIHALLMKDLGVKKGLRNASVGITGTQYAPLTIQSQIEEALKSLFLLLESIDDPIEKAIVALASIAYIQPFADGNKRLSRHFANLILHMHGLPPVAWRTVNEVEYKKKMINFYELGNIKPVTEMWVRHYIETIKTFFSL